MANKRSGEAPDKRRFEGAKKGITATVTVLAVTVIASLIQYGMQNFFFPKKEFVTFSETGLLIYDMEKAAYEVVQVDGYAYKLHYIFGNREDAVEGNLYIDGQSIFGDKPSGEEEWRGFYTEFYEEDIKYSPLLHISGDNRPLCHDMLVSKAFDAVVCGVTVDSRISGRADIPDGTEALLVIPAGNMEEAGRLVEDVAANVENMAEWLAENGWRKKEGADAGTAKAAEAVYDYNTVISGLHGEQAYAYVETEEGKAPILLVADGTYEYEKGINAAIACDVYYIWDKTPEKLLQLASDGTAYPIAADDTAIYIAGLHYVEKYEMNFETNELELTASAAEIFDTEGNVTYEGSAKGQMKMDGATFLEKLRKEYEAASVISFTKSK